MLTAKQRTSVYKPAAGGSLDGDEPWKQHSWGRAAQSPRAGGIGKENVQEADSTDGEDEGIDSVLACGSLLILLSLPLFCAAAYALVISKLLPATGNWILDSIKQDRYYCFLIPLTLPVTFLAVYFHWLSLKFFKHA